MAIINKITGYYGFTIDIDPENPSIDSNGDVNTCIVAITFPQQTTDVDFAVSNGDNDFAVKTGDGQIIPCADPQVIYVNRDNAIVQFSMRNSYPANSPVTLIYVTDTAGFAVTQRTETRPFEVNSVSGHFAYTVEGYKGLNITELGWDGITPKYTGLVNKVIATIPFSHSITNMRPEMTTGENDWGIRMGNGKIIPLKDPEIIAVNNNNFVALLTMHEGYSYPSNSPGILVLRSKDAGISIYPVDDDHNFYPVSNIYDVPTKMISGQMIDLNCARIEPYNASVQNIVWSVISGPGEIIDKHMLHASNGGSIVINGTIENGLDGSDLTNDYHQRFEIKVAQNVITKLTDPTPEIKAYVGEINHTIAVVAESTTDQIHYQWYKNSKNSYDGAVAIANANDAIYDIPENLEKGNSYYYCEITSDGAVAVKSKICHIYTSVRCTSITIYPLDNMMGWEDTRQMYIVQFPSDADLPNVNWFSSNDNIAHFDDKIDDQTGLPVNPGLLKSKFPEIRKDGDNLNTDDTVTITAVTTDILGEQLTATIDITIKTFIPVKDITGLSLNVNPDNTYSLSATVVPSDATNQKIAWSVSDNNESDIYISNDTLHIPKTVIPTDHQLGCMIMATIANGKTPHDKYQKEFEVFITHGFIEATDIIINNDTNKMYDIGNNIDLNATVLPSGASLKEVNWSIISGEAELHGDNIKFITAGNVTVRATVKNGAGTDINRRDLTKDFTFKCSALTITPVENVDLLFTHKKIDKIPVYDDNGKIVEYNTQTVEYQDIKLDPFERRIENGNEYDVVVSGSYKLPLVIIPSDATNKSMKIELLQFLFKEIPDEYGQEGYELPSDFDTIGWQTITDGSFRLENDVVFINKESILPGNFYKVNIRVTIKNGISSSEDFITDVSFEIAPPNVEPFIPIKDMTFEIRPNKLRALSPILLSIYEVDPFNASVKDPATNHINLDLANNGVHFSYEMEMQIDPEKDDLGPQPVLFFGTAAEMGFTVPPLDVFDFGLNEYYLYPWNPGKCKVKVSFSDSTVANINSYNKYYPVKKAFEKELEFEFLPPFIPVDKIEGIAPTIYAKQPYIIQGDASNIAGMWNYNPAWDEEDVTNKDIKYEIISNDCGATLTGNTLLATRAGTVKIRAIVTEGLAEEVIWYKGMKQDPEDYVEEFTINVVAEETAFSRNIVKLTLQDNSVVNVDKFGELLLLSTPEPSNSSITIKGKTFRKDQVVRVDFYENIHNDLSVSYVSTPVSTVDFDESDETIKLINGINTDPFSVGWEIISGTGGSLSSSNQIDYTNLAINHSQISVGGSIKVKCTVIPKKSDGTADEEGKVEREIEFKKVTTRSGAWQANPNLTSLCNFGRNFTNLTTINRIPDEVHGDNCLKNFLRGCTKLNCNIVIPNGVTGKSCLEFFLRDCTSFNSNITIPDGVTGDAAMHGFLMGCTHFNRDIAIPSAVTGQFCLKKFMYNCQSFNKPITIPRGVSGLECMFEFMAYCKSFNQPITLPDDVGNITYHDDFTNTDYVNGYQLDNMLFNANNFHSTVTVPTATGSHAMLSEKSFASANYNSPMVSYGITFSGSGASTLWTRNDTNKLSNHYGLEDGEIMWGPYRHITNLD